MPVRVSDDFCNACFWGIRSICRNACFTFQTVVQYNECIIFHPFLEDFSFQFFKDASHTPSSTAIISLHKPNM